MNLIILKITYYILSHFLNILYEINIKVNFPRN